MGEQDRQDQFDLDQSATHLLHRAQQVAVTLSAEALAENGLTIRQFSVLAALMAFDGRSQASLVDATSIDRSTLADMVARMDKAGLVRREPDPGDARAKAVFITTAGRAAFARALPTVRQADSALLSGLRAAQRRHLVSGLMAVADVDANARSRPRQTG